MRKILAVNQSGETIPAGGAFQVDAVFGTTTTQEIGYNAIKPDGSTRFFFINGPVDVPSTATLSVDHTSPIIRANVDWTDAAVGFGVQVGPFSGSFLLNTKGLGFYVMGAEGSDGLTPVLRQAHDDVPLIELLDDLGAANTGIETSPPTAMAGIFGRDGEGVLYLTPHTMSVINRGRDIEYGQGTRGYPKLIAAEWHFMPIECDQG